MLGICFFRIEPSKKKLCKGNECSACSGRDAGYFNERNNPMPRNSHAGQPCGQCLLMEEPLLATQWSTQSVWELTGQV